MPHMISVPSWTPAFDEGRFPLASALWGAFVRESWARKLAEDAMDNRGEGMADNARWAYSKAYYHDGGGI